MAHVVYDVLRSDVLSTDAVHQNECSRESGDSPGAGRPEERIDVRNRSSETNRHGIPIHGGDRPQCVWAKCQTPVGSIDELPLCNWHVRLVVDTAARHNAEQRAQDRAAAKAERERNSQPVIYYLRVGAHIKIGWTGQLEERMRQFPPNCDLLAVHPGTRKDEQALHKRFAVWRSHGREWYPLVPVLLEHIDRMVHEHGKPEATSFGARPVKVPQPRQQARPKRFMRLA